MCCTSSVDTLCLKLEEHMWLKVVHDGGRSGSVSLFVASCKVLDGGRPLMPLLLFF